MDQTSSGRHEGGGELWALGMALGYASVYVFDRIAVIHADPLVGPFLRTLPSLALGIVLVWKNKTLDQFRRASPRYIGRQAILRFVWAGLISTLGLFLYYFAISLGGVVLTAPLVSSYVIWGALFAWPLLGERLTVAAWGSIGVLVAGLVALAIGESHGQALPSHWFWAIPLGVITAVSYGISGVFWRDGQLRGAHQSTAILLNVATTIAVAMVGLAASGHLSALIHTPWRDAAAFLASGVLSGIVGVYCFFMALRRMSVARVYAFAGLQPLLATVAAYFLLREYLSPLILGAIFAISAGVTLAQVFRPKEERQA
jgi:drug/metabolite transporter (DMT)-like permease